MPKKMQLDPTKPHVFASIYADLCYCGKWMADPVHIGNEKAKTDNPDPRKVPSNAEPMLCN